MGEKDGRRDGDSGAVGENMDATLRERAGDGADSVSFAVGIDLAWVL